MTQARRVNLASLDINLLVVFDTVMREGSVTGAAVALHRTPSAISHALSRLREQMGDELLVRQGNLMVPTRAAAALSRRLDPVLRELESALRVNEAFDPGSYEGSFRIALPDITPELYASLHHAVRRQAPGVRLDFVLPRGDVLQRLSSGEIDLAPLPIMGTRPHGLEVTPLGTLSYACGMRRGHPAGRQWSLQAWAEASHLILPAVDAMYNPMALVAAKLGIDRRVGMSVPSFAAAGKLLEETDLIATYPLMALRSLALRHQITVRAVPFDVPPVQLGLYRSRLRLGDAAVNWLMQVVAQTCTETLRWTE